ncbi:MAG: zf-HC2 domain-containing protein, partial [Acidimicrobiales bacterium]
MTQPLDPPATDPSDDLDELVSAYLDGEATPEESARVDADPELQARVAGLRAVAAAVAGPFAPPSAEARESA